MVVKAYKLQYQGEDLILKQNKLLKCKNGSESIQALVSGRRFNLKTKQTS